jgi:choline-phosphate cytidylyltransferase
MTRSRQNHHDSLQGSDSSEEDSDERQSPRGRLNKENDRPEDEIDAQLKAAMAENSTKSGQ